MGSYLDSAQLAAAVRQQRGSVPLRATAKKVGVSPSSLSRVERGLSDGLNIRTYLAICDWLNLPPSYFLVSSNDGDSTVTNADRLAAQVRQCVQLPRKAAAAIADLIEVTIHKRD